MELSKKSRKKLEKSRKKKVCNVPISLLARSAIETDSLQRMINTTPQFRKTDRTGNASTIRGYQKVYPPCFQIVENRENKISVVEELG